jgi:hypothetical protein
MSNWADKFRVKQETTDSSYNQKVATERSNTIGKGTHNGLTLVAVMPVENWHAYDLTWENEEGATFKERCFVTYETKDKEGRPTGDRDIADSFVKLGLALSGGDNTLNQQYFLEETKGAYINVDRMKAAIGTKATVVIGLPKKGLTVKNIGTGMVIVDIETGEPVDGMPTFSEFKEIKDYAAEHNLRLTYNKVLAHRTFKDSSPANRDQLKAALEADKPKVKVAAKAQGF